MNMYKLSRQNSIPRKTAHGMVIAIVKYSNSYSGQFKTDADVKRYITKLGYNFDDLIMECRQDYKKPIPTENLLGSTWHLTGGKVSSNSETGEELFALEEPGVFTPKSYWALYEQSHRQLENSINIISYTELQSAIVLGIACIESYINYRAELWNRKHPQELLTDSKECKVTFEQKIDNWIPIMSNGKKFDKGNRNWANYKILRGIRDDTTIHAKNSGYGVSYEKIAEIANLYSTGISGLLIDLHKLFDDPIPAIIIRNFYAPPVEVIEDNSAP